MSITEVTPLRPKMTERPVYQPGSTVITIDALRRYHFTVIYLVISRSTFHPSTSMAKSTQDLQLEQTDKIHRQVRSGRLNHQATVRISVIHARARARHRSRSTLDSLPCSTAYKSDYTLHILYLLPIITKIPTYNDNDNHSTNYLYVLLLLKIDDKD